jgi:aminoacyl tRNA synthase complex-interacting multifunctional protein 1
MASLSLSKATLALVKRGFPTVKIGQADAAQLSAALYPQVSYTDTEKKDIVHWAASDSAQRLPELNTHLATRTTIVGSKPSVADISTYAQVAPLVKDWSPEQRTGQDGYHHIVRHVDFVQNADIFHLGIPAAEKIDIDPADVKFVIPPVDAKAEKERKKKEKAAAENAKAGQPAEVKAKEEKADKSGVERAAGAAVEHKKEKKEKKPKAPKAPPPAEKPPSPAMIDLRVGHILKCEQHPNADSLYVSTIAVGDAPGADNTSEYEGQTVRTVCSGLNGLVPLAEMQGRKIVAVCNLKPVTMRGIKSAAMVLAASPRLAEGEVDDHKGPVELVDPPAGAAAGERVYFEGWEGEPEPVLNPKKKIWETFQPGFTTSPALEVAFDPEAVPALAGKTGLGKLRTKGGLCSVKTLKGATVR